MCLFVDTRVQKRQFIKKYKIDNSGTKNKYLSPGNSSIDS